MLLLRDAWISRRCRLQLGPIKQLTKGSVVLVDKEGKEQTLEADTLAIAAGTRRSTLEATREGYLAGLSI